jgi:hypothetical protein
MGSFICIMGVRGEGGKGKEERDGERLENINQRAAIRKCV